jgi:hypothetical protein
MNGAVPSGGRENKTLDSSIAPENRRAKLLPPRGERTSANQIDRRGTFMKNWTRGLLIGCSLLCIGALIVSFALAIWIIPIVVLGLFLARKKI